MLRSTFLRITFALIALSLGWSAAAGQPLIQFKSRELQEGRNFLQRLTGTVSIGESAGSASYGYPIALPPGRGITPSLSLSYSSSAGLSEYGHGWELSIPLIERDPTEGAPRYTSADRFRYRVGFETRRLIYTNQTTPEGYAIYREESERSFSRYLLSDTTNQWRILTPDGKRTELGTTTNARRGRNDKAIVSDTATWLIARTIDTHGNYASYEYANDRTGRALPTAIRYTGNAATGAAPQTIVLFQWLTHWPGTSDVPFSYRRGYRDEFGFFKLSSISITTAPVAMGSSPAQVPASSPSTSTYSIQYPSPSATAPNSHINFRISTIAYESTPPVSFTYQDPWPTAVPFTAGPVLTGAGMPRSLGLTDQTSTHSRTRRAFVDVTGDGRPDIVDTERTCGGGSWEIWRNVGASFTLGTWALPADVLGGATYDNCTIRKATSTATSVTDQDFFDITGDGYPDIIYIAGGELRVCRGTGTGFSPCETWGGPPTGTFFPAALRRSNAILGSTSYTDVDFVDYNADGYVDRVSVGGATPANRVIEVVYNDRGIGWGARSLYNFPACGYSAITACLRLTEAIVISGVGNSRLYAGLQDVNGDGLPDFLSWNLSTSRTTIAPGTGGDFGASSDMKNSPPLLGAGNQTASGDYTAIMDLVDVNADRLPDFVEKTSTGLQVRYNFGGGWEPAAAAVTYPLPTLTNHHAASLSYIKPNTSDETLTMAQFTDVDGDDIPEFVSAPSSDLIFPSFATASTEYIRSGAISNVTSLGGASNTHFRFAATGLGNLPFPVHAPVEITRTRSPLYSNEPQNHTTLTTIYQYLGAAYDRGEHEFRGFSLVRRDDIGQGTYSETHYLQGKHTQGLTSFGMTGNTSASGMPQYGTNYYSEIPLGDGSTFVRLDRSEAIEGGLPWGSRSLRTDYSNYYFGQPRLLVQDDTATSVDDITHEIDYVVRSDVNHLMVAPSRFSRYKGTQLVAQQSWHYDDRVSWGTPPTKGNVVKEVTVLDQATSAIIETFFDDESTSGYGLRVSVIDPEGHTTSYLQDSNYHQYDISITTPLGVTHTSYHALDGSPADSCGPRHGQTSWSCARREIDKLGRTTARYVPTLAAGEFQKTLIASYSYDDWTMPIKMVETLRPTADTARRIQYRDGFGNVAQVKVELATGSYRTFENSSNPLGQTLMEFPARIDTAEPFSHSASTRYTSYTYDSVRSEIESATFPRDPGDSRPPATFSRINFGTSIDIQNEDGNRSRYFLDGFGRVKRAELAPGQAAQSTVEFAYDGNNHVTSVIDATGLVSTYDFDMGGRQIAYIAPDGEARVSRFDRRGLLREVTTPQGTLLSYSHDEGGRLTSVKSTITSTAKPVHELITFYDQTTPQFTGLTRSISTKYGEYKKTFDAYDGLGNATSISTEHRLGTSSIQFHYNTSGLLRGVTYPDGLDLKYSYNGADDLVTITHSPDTLAHLGYDARGNPTSLTNDFGLNETVEFDVRNRPVEITASNSLIPTPVIADSFTWTDAGNLAAVSMAGMAIGGSPRTQPDVLAYQYDPLSRLISASKNGLPLSAYTYLANGQTATLSESGTTKTNSYTADLLVAQTWSGGNQAFVYDENGNATSQTRTQNGSTNLTRDLYWDDVGRISSVADNFQTQTTYDYLGDELIHVQREESGAVESILELGTWVRLDLQTGEYTNRIIAGSRVVAEMRDENRQIVFPHRSLGGSVAAITDSNGSILRQEDHSPYGLVLSTFGNDRYERHFHGLRRDQLLSAGGRVYDPEVGRWLARDRALYVATASLNDIRIIDGYGYAFSAPTNYRDPSGQWPSFSWDDVRSYTVERLKDVSMAGTYRYNMAFVDETLSYARGEQDLAPYLRHVASNAMREAPAKNPLVAIVISAVATEVDDRDDDTPMTPMQMLAQMVPGVPGGGGAAASGLVYQRTQQWSGISRGWFWSIKPYGQLRRDLRGTGLQAHHIIEKRFARLFGVSQRKMAAVAVTPWEHLKYTNAWRKAIPYGTTPTRKEVIDAAKDVYKDNPEILNVLGL